MGLDLRVYATLYCTAIDNAGNEIKTALIEEFGYCWNFQSKEVEKIIDSENKINQYKESLKLECEIYGSSYKRESIDFENWIEKYTNWNIVFEGI